MEDKPIVYRLKQASRLCNETVKRLIRKNGISSTYFYILNYIIKHLNDMITQKDICIYLNMKPSTISVALQKMELDELILRKRDEADTRKMQILLTSKGKAEALEYRKIYKQADQILLGAISDSELKLLYELLDKLSLAMEEVL